jgi:transposase
VASGGNGHGACIHARRVDELQALARHSSGLLLDPGRAWRLEWLTGLLLSHLQAQAELSKQLKAQVSRHPAYGWLEAVPYAGPATLGVTLAVTGDVTRFRHYRRYVAYTGYYAGLEKSQTIDRTRMSRRGNRDLKRAYFQIDAPLVWFDRGKNPYKAVLKRKAAAGYPRYKAMPLVWAALAKHIYHCLKLKQPYDVEKAFGVVSPASEQALLDLQADLDERFEVMEAHLIAEEG